MYASYFATGARVRVKKKKKKTVADWGGGGQKKKKPKTNKQKKTCTQIQKKKKGKKNTKIQKKCFKFPATHMVVSLARRRVTDVMRRLLSFLIIFFFFFQIHFSFVGEIQSLDADIPWPALDPRRVNGSSVVVGNVLYKQGVCGVCCESHKSVAIRGKFRPTRARERDTDLVIVAGTAGQNVDSPAIANRRGNRCRCWGIPEPGVVNGSGRRPDRDGRSSLVAARFFFFFFFFKK
jgi:hypothetical protein